MTYYTTEQVYPLYDLLYNISMDVHTWYTKSDSSLSDTSTLEHILNYGTWNQIQSFIQTYGRDHTAELFHKLDAKQRSNLKPRISHYFKLYFSHAS
ncbi:MAG: hypothetical protein WCJ70_02095 [bacterium]